MRTIILAAGRSERFAKAGFPKPKSLLPMPDGRTLLEWQVDTLDAKHIYIIGLRQDVPALLSTIKKIISRLPNGYNFRGIWLDEKTAGPLDTIWKARSWIEHHEDFLFVYCDILPLECFQLNPFTYKKNSDDARMVVFESSDERFTDAEMVGFKESGIFWFRNGNDVISKMRWAKRGEYNGLPDIFGSFENKLEVAWGNSCFADLGVPNDYRNWMAEQGAPLDESWRPINAPR